MATPLAATTVHPKSVPTDRTPNRVLAVKEVTLALVTYIDNEGTQQTQLAVVGDNSVHLLSGKNLGISETRAQGKATDWLVDGIFKKLGRKK